MPPPCACCPAGVSVREWTWVRAWGCACGRACWGGCVHGSSCNTRVLGVAGHLPGAQTHTHVSPPSPLPRVTTSVICCTYYKCATVNSLSLERYGCVVNLDLCFFVLFCFCSFSLRSFSMFVLLLLSFFSLLFVCFCWVVLPTPIPPTPFSSFL